MVLITKYYLFHVHDIANLLQFYRVARNKKVQLEKLLKDTRIKICSFLNNSATIHFNSTKGKIYNLIKERFFTSDVLGFLINLLCLNEIKI